MDKFRIKEILDDSVGMFDTDNKPRFETMHVDAWIPLEVRSSKVKQHAAELKSLLSDWPGSSVSVIFTNPSEIRRISPRTFQRELDDFHTFALLAFGQVAGWWTLTKPTQLESDAGYQSRTLQELMGRIGFLREGSALKK